MTTEPVNLDVSNQRWRAWRELLTGTLGPLLALVLVLIFFAAADMVFSDGQFSTVRNLRVVLAQTSSVAVAALGMTLIIIAGGIDLSAGTALTLCATVMAYCLKMEYPIAVTMLATIGCGGLCGLFNGILISGLRVVPFIVTLGSMTIFLGIGNILSKQSTIFPGRDEMGQNRIPDWLSNFCSSRGDDYVLGFLPNIATGVIFVLLLALVVAMMLRFTIFGRYVFALGSNEQTARLCGINIPLMKIAVYTCGGLLFGVAGLYYFSQVKIGSPTAGQGIELDVIAAVVIGGGSLYGGRGSVLGSLCGAVIMAVIRSGCDQLEVPNPYQNIIIGAIIIAAVAVDQYRQRRSRT